MSVSDKAMSMSKLIALAYECKTSYEKCYREKDLFMAQCWLVLWARADFVLQSLYAPDRDRSSGRLTRH